MKKILFLFAVIFFFTFTTLTVNANSNFLHTITLEKNDTAYNIILETDKMTKVVKKHSPSNELILELSGVTSSDTVNAIYKGANNIDGLVVENVSLNKLRIYITAENINASSVIMVTGDGVTSIVGESFPWDKLLWTGFVLVLFAVIFYLSKKISEADDKILIKKDIKDREIELYRRYRREMDKGISLASKDYKMRSVMKKIDRKIDERLSSSLR